MALNVPYMTYSDRGVESTAVDNYAPFGFTGDSGDIFSSADENAACSLITEAATVGNFEIEIQNAPGGAASWIFSIRKNRANVLSLTISGSNTTAANTSALLSFADGDEISMGISPSGSPTTTGRFRCMILVSATNAILMASTSPTTAATWDGTVERFPGIMGAVGDGPASATDEGMPIPADGTLTHFRVKISNPPPIGQTRSFQLYVNGVQQFSLTFTAGMTDVTSDALIAVLAGDIITYRTGVTIGAGITHAAWGCSFIPTVNDGYVPYMVGINPINRVATTYQMPIGFGDFDTDETIRGLRAFKNIFFKKLYVWAEDQVGAGNTFLTDLRDDSVSTALSVTMTETDTTGNDLVDTVIIGEDSLFHFRNVPTSSPFAAGTMVSWGILLKWSQQFPPTSKGLFFKHTPSGGNTLKRC